MAGPWVGIAGVIGLLWALSGGPALAADTLDGWRDQAAQVRRLADNDAPRAYEEAKRLQAALPADAPPGDRARVLNLLARIETYMALTEPAAENAQAAFDLAARHGDRVGQAESDLTVALNSINQGRLDVQVQATTHSMSILEGIDRPDLLSEALLRTAIMYRRFEQFDDSVAVAVQAMEIARRSNNALALTYAHQGLAIAFDQSYRRAETREHYLQMRRQAQAAGSRLMESFAMNGLATVATASGDHAEGERIGREALVLVRGVGAPFAECFTLYSLGENLRAQGRLEEARQSHSASLAIYEKYPNPIGRWFSLNARSAVEQQLGNVDAALKDAEGAYAYAKSIGLAIYTSGSAQRLAELAASRGQHEKAYRLAVEAREMTTKAAREQASVRMLQLVKRYESESKQRQIDELTRRNEQQTTELRQRELQQRWLWTLLGGSIAVLAITAYFLWRQRRSHQLLSTMNRELAESRDAIRELNAGLELRVQDRTAEMRQKAQYLRTLIDMLPLWAWFKDTQNRYLVTNQAHAQARGHTPSEMVGHTDLEILPPDLARASQADDEHVMATRQRRIGEETLALGDHTAWMETYKAPVLDEDGTLLGTVGVARDISQHKAAEAARDEALAEARRLASARSEFLAQMSHELRTPLNAILGFSQILRGDGQLGERQLRRVGLIQQSGEHLLALINDILDLAKVDAGKLELSPAAVDLGAFLFVVADIIRVKADEKNLLFSVDAGPDLPRSVRVDEMRLRQVLLNLLANAVKFTDTGSVTLRVRMLTMNSRLGDEGALARLRFEIQDTGVGMDEAQMSRLFQPFEQVSELHRRAGGAGLGLAISRRLVQLMGGDITVRSEVDRGSTLSFELELPTTEAPVAASSSQGRVVGYEGAHRKILVVDDAPALRALLGDTLSLAGFDVAQASNGHEGLETAVSFRPDLIVMDLTMPVMDGLEATRQMRAQPALAKVPIIIASAATTAETSAACLAAGADLCLPKPIDPAGLLSAIGQHLELTWIHERTASPSGPASPLSPPQREAVGAAVLVPPHEELMALRQLARMGNMRGIRDHAEQLRTLDPRYAEFAAKLHRLADGYQSQAIVSMLEPYCSA